MTISRIEYEYIKAELANAIRGNPPPTFSSPEALQLAKSCGKLAGNPDLLRAIGTFAIGRLLDLQSACADAERELAILLPTLRNQ